MITLIGENMAGGPPTQAQLQQWAQGFGLTHPVVADPGWNVTVSYTGPSISLPAMHQIAPGGQILRRNTWISEPQIQAALP